MLNITGEELLHQGWSSYRTTFHNNLQSNEIIKTLKRAVI
jgi:hypothetical protein